MKGKEERKKEKAEEEYGNEKKGRGVRKKWQRRKRKKVGNGRESKLKFGIGEDEKNCENQVAKIEKSKERKGKGRRKGSSNTRGTEEKTKKIKGEEGRKITEVFSLSCLGEVSQVLSRNVNVYRGEELEEALVREVALDEAAHVVDVGPALLEHSDLEALQPGPKRKP
jgi:hypothetical protein